jgi:hypothetical protein
MGGSWILGHKITVCSWARVVIGCCAVVPSVGFGLQSFDPLGHFSWVFSFLQWVAMACFHVEQSLFLGHNWFLAAPLALTLVG